MTTQDQVTMREAALILGVSHSKIWTLVREGTLPAESNPLDRREKLIRMADLEKLKAKRRRPYPRTIGAYRLGIPSDQADEWLEAHWRPE